MEKIKGPLWPLRPQRKGANKALDAVVIFAFVFFLHRQFSSMNIQLNWLKVDSMDAQVNPSIGSLLALTLSIPSQLILTRGK